jgi:hypothetical protein
METALNLSFSKTAFMEFKTALFPKMAAMEFKMVANSN